MPFKAKGSAEMTDWANAATLFFCPGKQGRFSRSGAVPTGSVPSCDPMCHVANVQNAAKKQIS